MKRLFDEWLGGEPAFDDEKRHILAVFEEDQDVRETRFDEILAAMRGHYVDAKTTADRLAELGAPNTAALLREKLPVTIRARSGEMGEILATEVAEQRMGWRVPIRRLRWKDGREMALRGDDLTAIKVSNEEIVSILKGESKSRSGSIATALGEASKALERDDGHPTSLSVLFVAERMRESGEADLALKLEKAVLNSFSGLPIEHLLFVLTGTNPGNSLTSHLAGIRGRGVRRHIIGVRIEDHAEFIKQVFEAL